MGRHPRQLPIYAWPKERARLEELRLEMETKQDRKIAMAEVIRELIREHDNAIDVRPV